MFEQAVLRPPRVRGWAVTLGFAGEVLLVACVLVAPLIWPQLLPRAEATAWIFAPSPPLPVFKPAVMPRGHATRFLRATGATLYDVVRIPARVAILDDPPSQEQGPGVNGGSEMSGPNAGLSFLSSVIQFAGPKQPNQTAVAPAVQSAPPEVRQIRVSGSVEAARLMHRVDPVYPPLARQMRISGTVELVGVIGTDGHIRELTVASGNPFLAPSALDAVRRWVYQPTLLSGEPVEVITTISVVFRLN